MKLTALFLIKVRLICEDDRPQQQQKDADFSFLFMYTFLTVFRPMLKGKWLSLLLRVIIFNWAMQTSRGLWMWVARTERDMTAMNNNRVKLSCFQLSDFSIQVALATSS
ncbi:hypothetical protein CEXT_471401 [Caerostris extrusa]|uniref:Uncharacterized protein n=1 Tax=Caerostris extrusa TaxID=172846 RepID=A0AAV4U2B4_CAEEX|nr:hypothetical protein CEXT_471401 [Caerostris extrusa]